MASRSNTTFQKRLKELARQEKARDKGEKRAQRKVEKGTKDNSAPDSDIAWLDEDGNVAFE
ncbi:MAG: hypothetical protein O2968_05520 [Acidobacteria bacterium]|nr:hypothetical protein [Acidobacteriota bacterium]